MKNPDWYSNWRNDAIQQLQEKTTRLITEFPISEWPRYHYDFDAGQLIFSDQGVTKVIADIQIAGTTSASAGNWLWAWANVHLPQKLVTASVSLRSFGEKHGIDEMTRPRVIGEDLNALGWELTAVSVRVSNAIGAYRPPRNDGGGTYLLCKSIGWAN